MTTPPSSKPLDPRVLRTRQLIRNAFVDLLDEFDLEKITVNRIAERATINRVTFYLHYRDIPDMLDKIADDIIGDLNAAISKTSSQNSTVLESMLEHIADNAQLFKLMLATKQVPVFTDRFLTVTMSVTSARVAERFTPTNSLGVPLDILTWYLTAAFIGTIVQWLRHDLPYRPEYLAKHLLQLTPKF